jgi:hypothetical protein
VLDDAPWTQSQVPHPLYRATPSKLVPCNSPLCDKLHQDLGTTKDCRAPNQCNYEIENLDGSASLGILLLDRFSLPTANVRTTIAFGYATTQLMEHCMVDAHWVLYCSSLLLPFETKASYFCVVHMWVWPGGEGKGEGSHGLTVDGILGLGRGSVDLVSQLQRQKMITQNVIGHCFSSKGGGSLVIGDVPSSSRITWVPMSK